jgi:hypothetical protein
MLGRLLRLRAGTMVLRKTREPQRKGLRLSSCAAVKAFRPLASRKQRHRSSFGQHQD